MNGNLMYEVVRQRMAEQRSAAQAAGEAYERREAARELRKAARGRRMTARKRRAKGEATGQVDVPLIPDFADEILQAARDEAPAPHARGRHVRSGH